MNVKKILLWFWQLPQNVAGYILMRKSEFRTTVSLKNQFPVYLSNNVFGAGVCLGDYILLDYKTNIGRKDRTGRLHEFGHHRQSVYLGWFYLIVIGLPSLIGNLWDRLTHKKWTRIQRLRWYYNLPWEKWADKLGEVKRF